MIELGIGFLLSAIIGLECEIRNESAGRRMYTIVGTSATLFLLISKYGFTDTLGNDRIVFDPSRVATQIVAGICSHPRRIDLRKKPRLSGATQAYVLRQSCFSRKSSICRITLAPRSLQTGMVEH
jgi:putative Mg2+ transporter-C (MgtC) family protein